MAVSLSDCKIVGKAHDLGKSSHSILRQALTCSIGHSDGYAMIDMLTDDVLLEIFDAYRNLSWRHIFHDCAWDWDRLAHVCRRWRQLVFASPLRLSIYLHCTRGIDVKKFLGCWPEFPITVHYTRYEGTDLSDEDNILAALEHSDRVRHLHLHIMEKQLAKLATVIQKPFPMLTKLQLSRDSKERPELALPRGFLGGSAPLLQELDLEDTIVPEFPEFLSSACNLVTLRLSGIRLKSVSPETMVTWLAPLTRLTSLSIGDHLHDSYESTLQSDPALATRTRILFPALTSIGFESDIHYIEDFVSRIDCPRLNSLDLYPNNSSYDNDFQLSQIYKLLNRSEDPLLACFDSVYASISFENITLRVSHDDPRIAISIALWGEDWQHSHIWNMFNQFSSLLSNVRHLTFDYSKIPDRTPTNFDWAEILVAFSALQTAHIYGDHTFLAPALESIDGEMAARLLPDLDLLFIRDLQVPSVQVGKFCEARQVSGRPVTLVRTYTEFRERQKSYA